MFSVAVIVAVYRNDVYEDFVSAIKSIKLNQKLIPSNRIKVYLHIDGEVNQRMMDFITTSGLLHKVIHSVVPVGLARGLNKLISVLEDEKYVFRMDADDLSLSNRLQCQIDYMDKNLEIDISGGAIQEFVGDPENNVATRYYPLTHDGIFKVVSKASPFAHVTVCFRGSSLRKIGLYPIEYPLNEDIALWYQALKKGAVCGNIEQVLVKVRMDGAYNRRSSLKAFYEFKVYWNIMVWKRSFSIYPFMRFIFRFLPVKVIKLVYNSFIRKLVAK
jgi:hypothetical protein